MSAVSSSPTRAQPSCHLSYAQALPAAAASVIGLPPTKVRAAAEADAVRPFRKEGTIRQLDAVQLDTVLTSLPLGTPVELEVVFEVSD